MGAPPVSPSPSLCFLANAVDPFDAGVCVSMLPDLCISVFLLLLALAGFGGKREGMSGTSGGPPAVSGFPFVTPYGLRHAPASHDVGGLF